jgi:hypothetical protein
MLDRETPGAAMKACPGCPIRIRRCQLESLRQAMVAVIARISGLGSSLERKFFALADADERAARRSRAVELSRENSPARKSAPPWGSPPPKRITCGTHKRATS